MSDNNDFDLSAEEAELDAILRSMADEDLSLESPPDSVWEGIAAATTEAELKADSAVVAPVIDLASRRRQVGIRVAAIAAALALIAGFAFALTSGDDPDLVEVASAELTYLGEDPGFVLLGDGRSASVTLLREGDDEVVRFDQSNLPVAGADNDLELWLIGVTDGEIKIIQTLGTVGDSAEPGMFSVPEDFDRSDYDAVLVDISIEPHDGDEAHSGMSLVRGPLSV